MIVPDWAGYVRFRDAFAEATDPAFYPIAWLDAQVLAGAAWPIVGRAAALVVEVRDYPGGARVAHGLVAAGDPGSPDRGPGQAAPGAGLAEIVAELIPAAEAWGRARGCRLGLIESREGWAKLLRPHGWEPHQLTLRKPL